MKRKYGNRMPGLYIQDRIESEYFNGYLSYTKLRGIDEPIVVNNSIYDLCIVDDAYDIYRYLEEKYYNNIEKLKWVTKELIKKYSMN